MLNQAQKYPTRVAIALISAFALFVAVVAISQEARSTGRNSEPVASANVLPPLVISAQSLEPNLNGMLATGEGGALIVFTDTGSNR